MSPEAPNGKTLTVTGTVSRPAPTGDTQNDPAAAGDIVVTAQKRAQTVNRTSVAVTALGPAQLQAAGVLTVRDLTSAAPNVQIQTIGPVGFSAISVRGISNQDFTQLGSPAVAAYVDGVYVAVSSALSGGFYDVERIEILRGPQGTTYGQNATGGNMNVVTAQPEHEFGASAFASYGNYNDVQTRGVVNLPVRDDLAVRGAFMTHRSDGYFRTQRTTARNYAAADEFGGRLTALWTPGAAFTWRLSVEGYDNRGTPPNMLMQIGENGRPINGGSPYSQRFEGPHPEPDIDLKGYSIRSRMDWRFGDGLSLAYVAGYQHQKSAFTFGILGAGNREVYDSRWIDRVRAYTNEVDLTYDRGRLQNVLGVSQFAKTNPYDKAFHFYAFGVNIRIPGAAKQSSYGIFDQATFSVLDTLRLIGGVRYSHESQDTDRDFNSVICPIAAGLPATFDEIFAQGGAGCALQATPYAKGAWSNVSWKGGLEWDPWDRTLLYLTVTNGFKSGQVQPGLPAQFRDSINPEQVINYEAGLKTRLLGNRLQVRTALFNQEYKDIQVAQVTTVDNFPYVFSQNAGRARIYGAELEWQFQLSAVDHLDSFANYLHADYTRYRNAVDGQTGTIVPTVDGNSLAGAPRFSARIQYSHDFILSNGGKLSPLAAIYYQSKTFLREFNFPIDRVGGYSKTNLNLTYTDPSDRWTAVAFVENLEDKAVRSTGNTAANRYFSDYRSPRLYGLRVGFHY